MKKALFYSCLYLFVLLCSSCTVTVGTRTNGGTVYNPYPPMPVPSQQYPVSNQTMAVPADVQSSFGVGEIICHAYTSDGTSIKIRYIKPGGHTNLNRYGSCHFVDAFYTQVVGRQYPDGRVSYVWQNKSNVNKEGNPFDFQLFPF